MNPLRLVGSKPEFVVEPLADGARIHTMRNGIAQDILRLGPNAVHAVITHEDGSITDLGIGHNLLITSSAGGRDQIAALIGGRLPTGGQGNPATAAGATSFTGTGSVWTTNQLAGMRVVFPITGLTTEPVYGNIISNTTNVATVDGWWDSTGAIGTTPAGTSSFFILPGGSPTRYMALTENAGAASASDTALTGEITTGGCNRQLATYAHTLASATFTLVKAFAVTATFPAIHKMGIFNSGSGTAGSMMFESVLNADASVVNLDTLTVTDTVTVS